LELDIKMVTTMGKIAIRADGNSSIGWGHLIRTQALAQQLEKLGAEVIFLSQDPGNIKGFMAKALDNTADFDREDQTVGRVLHQEGADLLIVDSYAYEHVRLDRMRQLGWPIVYIDDLNRHPFDIDYVVNGNLYAPQLDYQGSSRFLLGPEYLLMREEFSEIAPRQVRARVRDILLTFGAADPNNLTYKFLAMLINYGGFTDLNWHVVLGPAFINSAQVLELGCERTNIHYHHSPDIKRIMDLCDICISAAGSTTYELARCGVPSILIPAAENQVAVAREAQRQGMALHVDLNRSMCEPCLFTPLENLISDYELRQKMAACGQELIDGRGAVRVAATLLSEIATIN